MVGATLTVTPAALATTLTLEWTRQLGTSGYDVSNSVAVDGAGNAYINGWTAGNLDGTNAGVFDAFLARYNANGSLAWTRQLGTSGNDGSTSVAVDRAGNAYISGWTTGSLGGPHAGAYDAFLARYNADGTLGWIKQLGDARDVTSNGVAVDGKGNVYISGHTLGSLGSANAGDRDAILARYNADGTLEWIRQLGTSGSEASNGLAVDASGNAYITGYTNGSLSGPNSGGFDAFLARYNADGTLEWTRQIGAASFYDVSQSVAVDSAGNAYISGWTDGSLGGPNAGINDAFLARYYADGSHAWTRQLGAAGDDRSLGVAVDGIGKAYISGHIYDSETDSRDAFLAHYNVDGTLMWTRQLDDAGSFTGNNSVMVDAVGNAYTTGYTYGSLSGPNAGDMDAFLAKYSIVPEPSSLTLIGFLAIAAIWKIRC